MLGAGYTPLNSTLFHQVTSNILANACTDVWCVVLRGRLEQKLDHEGQVAELGRGEARHDDPVHLVRAGAQLLCSF